MGAVSVGANGTAGGLAGVNRGTITDRIRDGDVTGAAGVGGITTLGGLVGSNQGEAGTNSAQISNSLARGNVGDLNIANLQAGGLVGSNTGTIQILRCAGRRASRGPQHCGWACRQQSTNSHGLHGDR